MAVWRAPRSFQQHMLDHVCCRRERHYNVMAKSVYTVKTVSVFTLCEGDVVSYVHCAGRPCMLFACLVHARAWRCVKPTFLGMFTLIIISFGTSFRLCVARCVVCSLRVFMVSAQCIVTHWPRGCGSLRVGRCVLSLSSWVCFCHC